MVDSAPKTFHLPGSGRNWALLFGLALSAVALLLALWGPRLSPADPLQESYIDESAGDFVRPPYAPGTVTGYPLGSDEFGRDVLSRILWGVRPTMILVAVVAALRLVLGIACGLLAGWSTHWLSRVLDLLISGALSIPVLFVALCVVAALASEWGVGAFILGLLITGWTETARLVQQQTRTLKTQEYVQAARAMGANSGQIILGHVIPHVMPLVWIQMAFEVSATLLAVAALGFLGYFVNAVWVPGESDFVGVRASGQPELGQMLGASVRDQPWTAAFAGSMVFGLVLAFNLLGEGLRIQLDPERRRNRAVNARVNRYATWMEEQFYVAVSGWQRSAGTGSAIAVLSVVLIGGGWFLWNMQNNIIPKTKIALPGGNLWAAPQRDAQSTDWSDVEGPRQAAIQWIFAEPGGLVGGPVIDADGNLYVNANSGLTISLTPQGVERWRVQSARPLLASPALTADGTLITADEAGSLYAYDRDGALLWHYASDPPDLGLSGPIVGGNDLIYYALQNFLVAVNTAGQREWQILLPSFSYLNPLPRLSADNQYLFFEDVIIEADTGVTLSKSTSKPLDKYMVGANGQSYLRENERVLSLDDVSANGTATSEYLRLDVRAIAANFRLPYEAGVAPSGDIWLLYATSFEYPRLVWINKGSQNVKISDYAYRPGSLIGIDSLGVAYMCGRELNRAAECTATRLDSGARLWRVELKAGNVVVGGAVIKNRLYVALQEGYVYAIGE